MEKTMPTPRASHRCTQKTQIAKINLLLLGNGNIKDGAIYKILDMAEKHEALCKDISDIKDKLSTQTEISTALDIARQVDIKVEEKLEYIKKESDIKKDTNLKIKGLSLSTITTICGIIMLLVVLVFQMLNYRLSLNSKKNNIENVK